LNELREASLKEKIPGNFECSIMVLLEENFGFLPIDSQNLLKLPQIILKLLEFILMLSQIILMLQFARSLNQKLLAN
jgi:hypothetical protein